jgi:hypothetical protein
MSGFLPDTVYNFYKLTLDSSRNWGSPNYLFFTEERIISNIFWANMFLS